MMYLVKYETTKETNEIFVEVVSKERAIESVVDALDQAQDSNVALLEIFAEEL